MVVTAVQQVKLITEMTVKNTSCTTSAPYAIAATCETTQEPQVTSEIARAPSRQRQTVMICGT